LSSTRWQFKCGFAAGFLPLAAVAIVFRRSRSTRVLSLSSQFDARNPRDLRTLDGGMIRKLKSGKYRLYSRKKNPKTGKRRNLGTFKTKAAAKKHEKAVQYFKRH
jgi:hypothetical protein